MRYSFVVCLTTLLSACSGQLPLYGVASDGAVLTGQIGLEDLTFGNGSTSCFGKSGRNLIRLRQIEFTCDDGRAGFVTFTGTTPVTTGTQGEVKFTDGTEATLFLGNS